MHIIRIFLNKKIMNNLRMIFLQMPKYQNNPEPDSPNVYIFCILKLFVIEKGLSHKDPVQGF